MAELASATRNTDLKPIPLCPIYPAPDLFFVEFPMSQSALIFSTENPCSLFRTTMPVSCRINTSVGSTYSE